MEETSIEHAWKEILEKPMKGCNIIMIIWRKVIVFLFNKQQNMYVKKMDTYNLLQFSCTYLPYSLRRLSVEINFPKHPQTIKSLLYLLECMSSCLCKSFALTKVLAQLKHLWGLNLIWDRQWTVSAHFNLNLFPHCSHIWDFSSAKENC